MKKKKKGIREEQRETREVWQEWITYVKSIYDKDPDYFEKDPEEWLHLGAKEMVKYVLTDVYWKKEQISFVLKRIIETILKYKEGDKGNPFDYDLIVKWILNSPQFEQLEENGEGIYFDMLIQYFQEQQEYEMCKKLKDDKAMGL